MEYESSVLEVVGLKSDLSSFYNNRKVLITGHTGFKGSWLAIWMKELEANVVGYALEPRTENDNYVVCGLENKIIHIDADLRDYRYLKSVFEKYEPEFVFHLAAQSLVNISYDNPLITWQTNLIGGQLRAA